MRKLIVILFLAVASLYGQAGDCGDCGQCWVVFFRCVADPNCPGSKFCTWVIQSEFCGSWDTRGCYPMPPLGLNSVPTASGVLAAFLPESLKTLHEKAWGLHGFVGSNKPACPFKGRKA